MSMYKLNINYMLDPIKVFYNQPEFAIDPNVFSIYGQDKEIIIHN